MSLKGSEHQHQCCNDASDTSLIKGLFTLSDSVNVTVTLTGKMGMQPILSITFPFKKIIGAAHQCYGDGDGIV